MKIGFRASDSAALLLCTLRRSVAPPKGGGGIAVDELVKFMSDKAELKVFIHIPKTSGSTVCAALRRKFDKSEQISWYGREKFRSGLPALAKEITSDTNFVAGHFAYGIDAFVSRTVEYFTILRHPVDRVISSYEFTRRRDLATTDMPEVVGDAKRFDIMTFMEKYPQQYNTQTHMLCGGALNLELARENLQNCFFGVQDFTDAYTVLALKKMGFQPRIPKAKNINIHKKKYNDDVIAAIRAHCEMDLALYEFAYRHFLQLLESRYPVLLKLGKPPTLMDRVRVAAGGVAERFRR